MKASRLLAFGDTSQIAMQDLPQPTPGAGEVLVKVHASSLNHVETFGRHHRCHHAIVLACRCRPPSAGNAGPAEQCSPMPASDPHVLKLANPGWGSALLGICVQRRCRMLAFLVIQTRAPKSNPQNAPLTPKRVIPLATIRKVKAGASMPANSSPTAPLRAATNDGIRASPASPVMRASGARVAILAIGPVRNDKTTSAKPLITTAQ